MVTPVRVGNGISSYYKCRDECGIVSKRDWLVGKKKIHICYIAYIYTTSSSYIVTDSYLYLLTDLFASIAGL